MSLSKVFYSPQVLVIPRKRWLRPDMTEKLLTWTLNLITKLVIITQFRYCFLLLCGQIISSSVKVAEWPSFWKELFARLNVRSNCKLSIHVFRVLIVHVLEQCLNFYNKFCFLMTFATPFSQGEENGIYMTQHPQIMYLKCTTLRKFCLFISNITAKAVQMASINFCCQICYN